MRTRALIPGLMGVLLLGAGAAAWAAGAGAQDVERGEHRAFVPLVAKDADEPLADLVPVGVSLTVDDPSDCTQRSNVGSRITVRNDGAGDAGPFAVDIEGTIFAFDGAPAGETVSAWFPAQVPGMQEITIIVDPDDAVPELDEANNSVTQFVPVPTPIAECTAAA